VNAGFLWEIDNKLREYGIEVPFPQRDLNLRSLFGSRDVEGLEVLRELLERHKAAEQSS
jgi:small-conductance mechanosensitive channel